MEFEHMLFTSEHEWIRFDEDGDVVVVGISEYASTELGDIVFIELPKVAAEVSRSEAMGTIEAVKTVADLFAPVSGTVVEVNVALESQPELVNKSPYEEGWFVKLSISDRSELDQLMDYDAYQNMIGES
jgi:glycine cleavage system H protein